MEGFDERKWKALKAKADEIKAHASARQHKAADPEASVFVSAHAGSGKTYLLVNRVIRLLLDGARPESILCLTYTKAAATEMRTRIFERLAGWIDLNDEQLLERIHGQLDHKRFPRERLALARRLFARALETPGGLRVMTIHAFCERVLQAFPVEAGMPPGFEVLDEAEAQMLLDEARVRLLLPGADAGTTVDGVRPHLARLAEVAGESTVQAVLSALMRFRRLLAWMADDPQRRAEVVDAMRRVLRVDEEPHDAEGWRQRWFAGLSAREVLLQRQRLESVMTALEAGAAKTKKPGKSDGTALERLAVLADAATAGDMERAWEAVRGWLLTGGGTPRKTLLTAPVRDAAPDVFRWLREEQERFADFLDGYKARRMLAMNESLLEAGRAILSLYEKEKSWRGKFDYDDLVVRTLELLGSVNGQWVLYRLDGGIDHILLDEAQDTSPEQWMILGRLTEEFFAGEGVERPRRRTVFAVGDVKQSIYSFQGAAPDAFLKMRAFFRRRVEEVNGRFRDVPMEVSFRSVPQVLEVVDAVLAQEDLRLGEEGIPSHASARPHVPGFVELWPLEEADADDDAAEDGDGADPVARALRALWTPPATLDIARDARLKLARRIAATIRRWLDDGEALAPDAEERERRGWPAVREPERAPRPIRPRDILILVRNRTTLMEAIVSALKQFGIPVAGVDRLKVSEHIAVRDLISLARFLLLPDDDLSLAEVLKSPLVERDDGRPFDDDDLLRLRGELFDFSAPLERVAAVNEARSLWTQLQAAAEAGAPVRRAVEHLRAWRRLAGFLPPYELFATVLWRDGGMRRFIARLSHEAVEPLEAFMDLAMQFERDELPSLPAFIEWILAEAPEISREQESGADMDGDGEVRVMTVHGAKGLEAPVVFLADTVATPDERHMDVLEAPWPGEEVEEKLPVWVMRQDDRCAAARELVEDTKKAAEEEYNRLLYVAMTRAADRLYVCGAASRKGGEKKGDEAPKDKKGGKAGGDDAPRIVNWHERIARVLCRDEYAVTEADGSTVWRYPPNAPIFHAARAGEAAAPAEIPGWARREAPEEPGPAPWLTPSRLLMPGMDEAPAGARSAGPDDRSLSPLSTARLAHDPLHDPFRRGVLIHKLLQYLPDVPEAEREARALAWLTMPAQGLSEEQARALWCEVSGVLRDARFAPLFGPRAQAEAPFAARLAGADGRPLLVSGQIDRLAVLDDEVIIADFKTARPVPERMEDVPESNIRQLALYRLAMADVWPDRRLRAALLFTAGPTWLEIPEAVLKKAVERLWT